MDAAQIRTRFLEYFQERQHTIRPSGPLVPADDPTLLFTNSGMVPFKRVFLGLEQVPFRRAVSAQKCIRAGGKHNDLEEVGATTRHHTFFEMLGNFSFGDYFKREAIAFAWEFLTEALELDPDRLFVTVHESDDEAAGLWSQVEGLDPDRIFRLGDEDNFWQMADTGPCGPCSELHYDLRPEGSRDVPSLEEFVTGGEAGRFIELWNLVFMQYDRDQDGVLQPLPAPSIDTGAGLERLAAVIQGVDSNYHTDLFLPLLETVADQVGRPYEATGPEGVSYRVLADHARAVAFLLADGVFPSSEGRGYVLRRILRRAVRHAWLLGLRTPTLVSVVERVIGTMAPAHPELDHRKDTILRVTREEEERFFATIQGGMERFDQVAPVGTHGPEPPILPGDEVFRLYDTFGFPPDLTELMARERGYRVDHAAFEKALERQRARSRADRLASDPGVSRNGEDAPWTVLSEGDQEFVGYRDRGVTTTLLAAREEASGWALQLRENPFYAEAGGQVSDRGRVEGPGWSLRVDRVWRTPEEGTAVGGVMEGSPPEEIEAMRDASVRAIVEEDTRHDTERNHTATHLLHAALRETLGDHVVQRGSLVAQDRLRFDFSHGAPLTPGELREIEDRVNDAVFRDFPVRVSITSYEEAVGRGAMALFGEKYGDRVRVVEVPGVSLELCGGTHLRHTGEVGLFRIVREGGVAAGVRRIEAVTGRGALRIARDVEQLLEEAAEPLRTAPENLPGRIRELIRDRERLEELVRELRSGSSGDDLIVDVPVEVPGGRAPIHFKAYRIRAGGADDVRGFGDSILEKEQRTVTVVDAVLPEGKRSLFTFVTHDLVGEGIRADVLVRDIAGRVGGRGGGRPHMAQAGVEDPEGLDDALAAGPEILKGIMEGVAG